MALSSSNYTDLSHSMTSFLSLSYSSSSSSISTDTPSSTSTATDPATTSSHTLPGQQQHTSTITETNNSQGGSDLFQQSWKSESFMGLLNLLHSEPPVGAAQTTVTNNHIMTSDSICPWTALDNSGGADWESEQLRSLLNLSDADMDLFRSNSGGGGLLVHETAPLGQQALLSSPSITVGQMVQQQGISNAQHQYQQQLLHQQQQQQRRRKSSLDVTTTTTTSRLHSSTPLTNPRHATCMTPSIPPAEIKRSNTKGMFVHPGFYSLSSSSQQSQRPSSQQQQGPPVKMGMKRSFQEDDSCPTTNSTFSSSPSPSSSHRHHHHGAMMQGMDLRRHSVDGYHVAAKAAAAAAASSKGGSASPARPRAAWAYSTPPKTPPTSMFHPHAGASTVDYSQVPPGQPYMANNTHIVASPLVNHRHHYGTGSPASSPFQPATHFVRSHSSPAGTKLSSAASALINNSPTSTTDTSGNNSNSGTPRKRRASKFRTDSALSHTNNASAGMIPFDPTALLSHFGLANTLPPPLQQQHPSTTTTQGFQQPQSEHAVLFQQQQQQQLQAAICQQQHQQFAAAAAAAIGAASGVGNRSGSNSISGQQNAHAFLMQHLISDPRLSAAGLSATGLSATGLSAVGLSTPTKQQHSTTATAYRRNPGEVPSSTLPPDHFIFQEASLLNRNRQQAAQQHYEQQQQQAKQALQAKQLAQQQGGGGGGGCARSNSISTTTTTGVDKGSGKAAMSRRRSEPVNLYQQHQKQQQQHRLLQAQQTQQYQHQHQHQQQQQQQYHLQQQQRHLTTVKEVKSPHTSPIPTNSSSSACESAIPCGLIAPATTAATMTRAAEDVSVGGVDDAEKKKMASQPEVEFDMSSIAIATEAVDPSAVTTLIIESMPDQKVAVAVAATTIDTDIETSLTSTADHVFEFEPVQEVAKLVTAKPEHQVVEQSINQDEQREEGEQEEKKEEGKRGPLTAAETFAKSLTAVTTTMDPAATQLMDQLRLQEYLCLSVSSTSLPTGTPSTTVHGYKK